MQISHWKNAKPYPSLLGGKGDGVITLAFFCSFMNLSLQGHQTLLTLQQQALFPSQEQAALSTAHMHLTLSAGFMLFHCNCLPRHRG